METNHPEQLGRYDLIRVRGSGAMGRVYEGFDPALNRQVAIKTIRLEHLSDDMRAEFMARFRVEAHAAGRLHSPNIVSIYDAGREGSVAYLVMELVDGRDLREILASAGPFGLGRALHIMRDLLGALETAHGHGIVHRDVKPGNIFVDATGTSKLGDFGAARILDSGDATLTGGSVIGTLKYMSPEQLRGEPVDPRVDIYAAGVVLYEMLTWKKPFDGDNDYQVCQSIMNLEPAPASTLVPTIPESIDRFIDRAICKDRARRFATAADFSRELADAFPAFSQPGNFSPFDTAGGTTVQQGAWVEGGSSSKPRSLNRPPWGSRPETRSGDPPALDSVLRESELVYWKDVKDSSDPEEVEGFLAIFPSGMYAELARRRIRRLRGVPTSPSAGAFSALGRVSPGEGHSVDPRSPFAPGTGTGSVRPMAEGPLGGEPIRVDDTLLDRRKVEAPRGLETERRDRERQAALKAQGEAQERLASEARAAELARQEAERQSALEAEREAVARRMEAQAERNERERQAALKAERDAQERLAEAARLAEVARQEAEREAEERRRTEEAERSERARLAALKAEREAQERLAEEARLAALSRQEAQRQAALQAEREAAAHRRAEEAARIEREHRAALEARREAEALRLADDERLANLARDESRREIAPPDKEHHGQQQLAASVAPRASSADASQAARPHLPVLAVLGALAVAGAGWLLVRPSAHGGPDARPQVSRMAGPLPAQEHRLQAGSASVSSSGRSLGALDRTAGMNTALAPTSAGPPFKGPSAPDGQAGESTDRSESRLARSRQGHARAGSMRQDGPVSEVRRPLLETSEAGRQAPAGGGAATPDREQNVAARVEIERVRQEVARLESERIAAARIAQQQAETARIERERTEAARVERERAEAERVERARADSARLERERAEAAKAERERPAAASAAASAPRPSHGTLIPTL